MPAAPQRILHVLNYAWPYIDGYTVRSMGIVAAQRRHLDLDIAVAVSPFTPFPTATDRDFVTDDWGPDVQIDATRYAEGGPHRVGRLERPAMGLAPATSALFRRELAGITRRLRPDVIHAHHPHYIASTALDLARDFGLPSAYEIRCFNGDYDLDRDDRYSQMRGRYQNRLEERLCRRASAVVTISDGLARRIVGGGTPEDKVFVVRNSVNTDLFTPKGRRAPLGEELSIGYATTFEQIENLDLLHSTARLRSRLAAQNRSLRVTIAGTGRDWERIRRLTQELGLADTVHLPGFVPYGQMPAFYHDLDLFVVPRGHTPVAQDTTPLKPLEALATGLPVLVSDLPAMRELLGGRPDVRFFEPEVDDLTRQILAFAANPWPADGRGLEDRSWHREVHRYTAVYATAAGRPASNRADRPALYRLATSSAASAREAARRVLRTAVDSGMPGLHPLRKHIVVCGFPRSGSTLFQVMVDLCIADVRTFPEEVDGLWAARAALRNHPFMLTKKPDDFGEVDALRAFYRDRRADVRFLLTLRDPRAVLTSTHDAYPASRGYYVLPERWRRIYDAVQRLQGAADVTLLRYEQLVRAPDEIEAELTQALGWTVKHPFSDFYAVARQRRLERDSMTEGALGGLRPLDPSRLDGWQHPEHRDRLRDVLDALPELPSALIELGYEQDDAWLALIEEVSA